MSADEQPVELPRRPTNGDSDATGSSGPSRSRRAIRTIRDAATVAVDAQITRRHPLSVVHFVTRRCNARCSFCFIDFDHPSPRSAEMSLEEIDRLTRTFGPALMNVNLTGGEPFLRGDLTDIVRCYYRNADVRSVYITSNGWFTDRAVSLAQTVRREHPDRALIVSLSIDAFAADHDAVRRVDGLFDRAMTTYHALAELGPPVTANIAITVSHENHATVPDLYRSLLHDHGVRAITAIVVRDEGVHHVPTDARDGIVSAYRWLTRRIVEDQRRGILQGYDTATVQGRLMNRKNEMLWDIVADTYDDPRYVSPCRAGALFGVIDADATVHPCEVLDRPLGNLRDHDLDFTALWQAPAATSTRKWIVESECHCSYECAWGFNILGNARYQPRLLSAVLRP